MIFVPGSKFTDLPDIYKSGYPEIISENLLSKTKKIKIIKEYYYN